MHIILYRGYQLLLRLVSYALPWRVPELIEGAGSLAALPDRLSDAGIASALIVTDHTIRELGLIDSLTEALGEHGIAYDIFDETVANPTIDNVETALERYRAAGCQALIAVGGGSPIDCAKGIACRVARPRRTLRQLRGLLRVHHRLPMLIAVPTTAGTGSETTLAAVLSDPDGHDKFVINDPSLIPRLALLDPALLVGLPASITSTTGMDALTHAVEAYIGRSNTRRTRAMATRAAVLIFENLETSYRDGGDLRARAAMQRASYFAGVAFTRAYVGYAHAVAHALGGRYGTPHGLACAVTLPVVLEAYGDAAQKRLAELALATGVADAGLSLSACSKAFIAAIRNLNANMGIPTGIAEIDACDIGELTRHALREANPLYPVPRILGAAELQRIFEKISV
ncbi:iron-containing alcohol dehydrogenase [Coriobacterium glomerans]|nr:iron-containing alcohol dehydrogenase [Coriobacterium glomerans]